MYCGVIPKSGVREPPATWRVRGVRQCMSNAQVVNVREIEMNATSLYVSTCRVMLAAGAGGGRAEEAQDLFRLLPYLRAALSCAVCGHLVRRAATPHKAACPHAVCRGCRQGRKRLKPACPVCRDLRRYRDNCQLRILLQSYKRLCEYFTGTDAYETLRRRGESASAGLVELIEEGAGFSDGYQSTAGLTQSAYSILPCVYANSATQTASNSASDGDASPPSADEPPAPVPLYSVARAPAGNKITIKRTSKPEEQTEETRHESEPEPRQSSNRSDFKKPTYSRSRASGNKRKGCRCGNATAAPGKLTCCGQRCPCYVESKACIECKCKGCRNPHRADGLKVRPRIPQLENINNPVVIERDNSPSGSGSTESSEPERRTTFEESSNIEMYSRMREVSLEQGPMLTMDEDASSPATDEDSGDHSLLQANDIYSSYRRSSPRRDNTSDVEVDA